MEIDIEEVFPHLPKAPIVEAVVDLRARATVAFEEKTLKPDLEKLLEGYKFLDSQREFKSELKLPKGEGVPQPRVQDLGWKGIRFQSEDRKHIAQFNRNGFVFSRLEPYQNWISFEEEAIRLWREFDRIAKTSEILRIGLRFINRIQFTSKKFKVEDFFRQALQPPDGLEIPINNFLYRDTLSMPGHPYAVNSIRTIQQPVSDADNQLALILDIDVFTTKPMKLDLASLKMRLKEMRWLKNKVFFGTVTEQAQDSFK